MWHSIISLLKFSLFGVLAILGAVLLALFIYNVIYFRRNRLVDKIPGPETTFLFGNSLPLMKAKREELFPLTMKLIQPYCKYPAIRMWTGPFPQVIIQDAKLTEAILSSSKLIDKGYTYTFLKPWLGIGLLLSSGKKWHTRRKMITPSFHFRILEEFYPIMREHGEILTEILKKFDGKGAFDIYPYLGRCALDIICETAMGRRIHAQSNTESEYVKAVIDLSEIVTTRSLSPLLSEDFVFNFTSSGRIQRKCLKILHDFTNKIIMEKRQEVLEKKKNLDHMKSSDDTEIFGKKKRLAFLDMLLESTNDGQVLSDADIREEVDTFMFEGHDTTASGMNWTLYNLGRLPHIQDEVHQELDRVFGGSDRPVTSEDLKELKYLECVIKESLRLFPPVPLFGRQFQEDVDICGITIPGGVEVNFSPYMIQRNPEYFTNPEEFDPSRFLPENSVKRHPYAYIPFSAGPRNCIGQKFAMIEEKLILSQIMRKFRVISMEKLEDLKIVNELVLRPANGMWVKLESR